MTRPSQTPRPLVAYAPAGEAREGVAEGVAGPLPYLAQWAMETEPICSEVSTR